MQPSRCGASSAIYGDGGRWDGTQSRGENTMLRTLLEGNGTFGGKPLHMLVHT
jgi:hypothetical protein